MAACLVLCAIDYRADSGDKSEGSDAQDVAGKCRVRRVSGVAAGANQGPGLDSVMREKLAHAQKILEAVVTSDCG
jgi:hypothetical protein